MSGESTMKATIFAMPESTSPCEPQRREQAPISPPASACEDDEGSPHHQVSRFQTMAPISAAKITASTITSGPGPGAGRSG